MPGTSANRTAASAWSYPQPDDLRRGQPLYFRRALSRPLAASHARDRPRHPGVGTGAPCGRCLWVVLAAAGDAGRGGLSHPGRRYFAAHPRLRARPRAAGAAGRRRRRAPAVRSRHRDRCRAAPSRAAGTALGRPTPGGRHDDGGRRGIRTGGCAARRSGHPGALPRLQFQRRSRQHHAEPATPDRSGDRGCDARLERRAGHHRRSRGGHLAGPARIGCEASGGGLAAAGRVRRAGRGRRLAAATCPAAASSCTTGRRARPSG